jgi:WD40 repeat protein
MIIPPQKAIVALEFFLIFCAGFPHAFADRSIELFLQLGHTISVSSVVFSPDGKLLASGSWDRTVKLWAVASGQEPRTLRGYADKVSSVVFSPDGKLLASSGLDSTAKIWDIDSGAIQVSMAFLPGNEWIAYHPQKLVYNSSLQGDEYAAIRFDNQLSPVYPLNYYRKELKRADLARDFLRPQPVIEPKWIRLWWDR